MSPHALVAAIAVLLGDRNNNKTGIWMQSARLMASSKGDLAMRGWGLGWASQMQLSSNLETVTQPGETSNVFDRTQCHNYELNYERLCR